MTLPNLTPQGADVALDPMQGTLQAFHGRTALQCQARGCDGCLVCTCRSTDFMQVDQKSAGGAGAAPDSFARAGMFQDEPFPPRGNSERGTANVPGVPENVPALNVNVLALDLGAKTGWALRRRDAVLLHGTEDFTPRASWAPGQKWQRFRAWLSATVMHHNITQIAFEDVKRHGPGQVLAAHAYGGFRAMLEMVADQHRVTLIPFGVGQIKKHWTGSGVAKKDEMVMQAKVRGFRAVDDNNADALAILHLAIAREIGEWAASPAKPKRPRKAGTLDQERKA